MKYVQTRALLWERHQKRTGAITLPKKNLEARGNEDCGEGSSSKQCTKSVWDRLDFELHAMLKSFNYRANYGIFFLKVPNLW